MITAVIVDDEANNVASLKSLVQRFCTDVDIVGTADSAETALPLIQNEQPGLVFLDIEMPRGNGFDLLEKLMPVSFEVIFVTAFNEYAIKAFRYSALDYLLKPVNIEELKQAVTKAGERIQSRTTFRKIENLLANLPQQGRSLKKIALPAGEGLVFEDVEQILRIEASANYTLVYTADKRKLMVTRSIGEIEELLPESDFCRIHNSHLINLNRIKKYFKGRGGYIEMEDGTTIEVSVRKKDFFLNRFS
jgi:two-component system, LytTR family, response regulator